MTAYKIEDFNVADFQDEVRVDNLVKNLLKDFHQNYLLSTCKLEPLEAGAQAAGADYLLRDFIIDHCRKNIFALNGRLVRQFGGNWYIVKNLEPNLKELDNALRGISHFARFCKDQGLISPAVADEVITVAANTDWFEQRINAFFELQPGDDYANWCAQCSLEDVGLVR